MPLPKPELWMDWRTERGPSLGELSDERPVLLVFLRHNGCTFCREALSDLSKLHPQLKEDGNVLVLVHQGEPAEFQKMLAAVAMNDCDQISDQSRELYRIFGLKDAGVEQLLSPRVMLRGIEGLIAGHGIGWIDGKTMQMPGAFVLIGRRIAAAFVHKRMSDRPDYLAMLRSARERATSRQTTK